MKLKIYTQFAKIQSTVSRNIFLGLSLIILSLFCGINSYGQTTVTFTSSSTFTVPAGVTSIQVQCWGGGGAGGGCQAVSGAKAGGGGAGGTYTLNSNVSVVPLSVITVTVGAGGTGVSAGNGNPGGTTTFGSSTPVTAVGGGGGIEGTSSAPNGAGASASVGITHNGGAGQNGTGGTASGGGGGSAGTAANGNTGTLAGVAAVTGGGPGANGISSAGNGASPSSGPGGGGGGAYRTGSTAGVGGNGFAGQVVVVYYPAPTVTSYSPNSGCIGNSITITGTNFVNVTSIHFFNNVAATSFTVNSPTSITVTIPTGASTGAISVSSGNGTGTGPSFTVNGTAPVITCPANVTGYANSSLCGNTITYSGATTSAGVITYSQNSNTFFPVGITNVIATATSGSCVQSCSFNITVNDTTRPVLTNPGNLSACSGIVTYTTPTATDNCSGTVAGSFTFSFTGSIVNWTVPTGVTTITMTAKGAAGGTGSATGSIPGAGASMTGTFSTTPGQILSILVGQCPGTGQTYSSGGGGTYVALGANNATATPLLVAGGGGGGGSQNGAGTGVNATITTTGAGANPGTNGNGAPSVDCGGGGGGFFTSGSADNGYSGGGSSGGGAGFRQGGAGGTLSGYPSGGFGGGAPANYIGSCNMEAGAGGGYSGGSGLNSGSVQYIGYGGGSYNGGTNQTNTAGANTSGNGVVIISYNISYPTVVQTAGLPSGGTFPIGVTSNTFIATDIHGNTSTCSFTVTCAAAPPVHTVTGGGSYCSGGSGLAVGLNGSETTTTYHLLLNNTNVGSPMTGTGSAFSFPNQFTGGVYTVTASNSNCSGLLMTGSATITVLSNSTPVITTQPNNATLNTCTHVYGSMTVVATNAVSYQWYLNGNSISGATSASYTPSAPGSYYVICTNPCASPQTLQSNTVSVSVTAGPTFATLPYTQTFEGTFGNDACGNTTNDVADGYWNNTEGGTSPGPNDYWHRDDYVGGNWTAPTSGAYTPTGSQGSSHSAKFHIYEASSGSAGFYDLFVDLSPSGNKLLTFDWITNDGGETFAIKQSTDGGVTFPTTLFSTTGASTGSTWTTQSITLTGTSATTVLRFAVLSDFGDYDLGLDNLNIVLPCNGSPTPGNTIASANPTCPGTNFSLSLQYNANGQTYQWQSSPDSSTWTNISGATSSTYNTSLNSPYYYQCVVTCTSSGLTTISTPIHMTIAGYLNCYCSPSSQFGYSGSYGWIKNVTFNSLINSSSTALVAPYYQTYADTGAQTTSVTQLVTYPVSITSQAYNWTGVWIDWNQDGIFETSEYYSFGYNSVGSVWTSIQNITIPITATPGLTRMRVRTEEYAEGDTGAVYSCNTMYYGESKDYFITVIAAPPCTGTPTPGNTLSNTNPVCPSTAFLLTLQSYDLGQTYQWQSSSDNITWTNIPAATGSSYSGSEVVATYYRCNVTCTSSGLTATSTSIHITINNFTNCYCIPSSTNGPATYGKITLTTFNTLNNSTPTALAAPYYNLYPTSGTQTTSITQLQSYTLSVTSIEDNWTGVWIDWNQDGIFETNEYYSLGFNSNGVSWTGTKSITVPITALLGQTRMRVRTEEYGETDTGAVYSCNTTYYGETMDYTITVLTAPNCTGTPSPGNTLSTLSAVCYSNPQNFTLSLQNSINGAGGTYQWQSSPNDISWTNISGATSPTYTTTESASTYYQCIVTCTSSGLSATSTPVLVTSSFLGCYCIPTSDYGAATYGKITNTTFNTLNNNTPTALAAPYYNLYPTTGSQTTSVTQLVNYTLSVTSIEDNWTGVWIDWNQDGVFETNEYYSLGYNSGAVSWTGTQNITIPITALTGQTRMRVRTEEYAEGDTGAVYSCNTMYYGETMDYTITIVSAPPCSGTPNPGNTISTLSAVCNTNPQNFTLSLQNNINGAGGAYQWQSSSNNISWTNISGATSPTYTTTESASTYYQCIVTCTSSGLSATSTPVLISSSFLGCYCTSTSQYGGTDGGSLIGYYGLITNETFNNLNHNKSIGLTNPYYELYPSTGTDTTSVYVGSSYTLSMTSYYYNWAGAWIDYNHSGTFDANEYYSFGYNSTGVQWTGSQTITIPLTATGGPTRIRFRTEYYGETDTGATNACTNMFYGETEDFNINIVYPMPTISGYSVSNACIGNTITINGTNFVGVDSVKFSNNVNVSFVVNSTTSISVVVPAGAATGNITVITGGGTATGPSFGVNGTAPVITTQPATAQFCTPGTSLTPFTVVATGAGINYQWYKNNISMSDGGNISGSQTSTLNISNPTYSDTAIYYVSVYSSTCVTNSNNVSLFALGTNPSITSFSALPNTICVGATSNLNAVSTGAYINWWTSLTGGNLLTTTPSAINYSVSPTSTTTYYSEAQDFSQVTQTISSSESFTIPVGVTSITAYLWGGGGAGAGGAATNTEYDNGGGGGGGACTINTISVIPGQVYTITIGAGGAGSTGAGGNGGTTSIAGPAGTFNATGGAGGAIAGTGTGVGGSGGNGGSTGTGTIMDGGSGSAGNNGNGITGTGGGGAGSGGFGTTPASACGVIGSGGPGNFAGGNGGYNTLCGNNDGSGVGVNGTIPGGGGSGNEGWLGGYAGGNGASGQVVLTWLASGCASTTRTPITVTVNQLPVITNQPNSTQTICSGNSVSIGVTATGSNLTYQWYNGSTPLTNGGVISGVNTSTLTINPVNISNASNNYNVVITGIGGCSVTSNNSAIIVNSPPSINSQPVSQFACATGSSASFTVGATGTSLSYQWYKGSTPISNGGNISGATSSTLTINPVNSGNFASNYNVIITGICGTPVTSNNVSLSLTTTPVILTQPPVSSTGCTGSSVNISVVGSAVGSYQWYLGSTQLNNSGNISGATSATLTISSLTSGNAASNYNVVLTGCSTSVTSNNSALVVASLPTPVASSNSPVCTLNSLSLSTTPNGMTSYSWSGPSSFSSNVQNPSVSNPVAGTYNVTVTDGNNCTGISSTTISITSGITSIIASSTSPICSGSSSQLSSLVSTTPLSSNYTFTTSTGTYSSNTGSVTTLITGVGASNQNFSIPIPFTFNYLGVNYSSLFLNTNGFITFGSAPTSSSSTPISSTDSYTGAIAAQSMVGLVGRGTGARLNYSVAGTAPNRTFSLIWYRYTSSGDGDFYDFEIVLNETTNVIDIIYDYEAVPTETTTCQVGLRGNSNLDFNNRSTGSNWASTNIGTSNTAICALSPSVSPGADLEFIFTPTANITYNWSPSYGLMPNSTSQNVTTPSLFYPSTNNYTVIATASNGCTASAQTSVVVNQSPNVTVTPHISSYCVSNINNISLNASGADTYTWTPINNLSSTTGSSVIANPTITTSYIVTGFSNSLGCSYKDTAIINVGLPVILSTMTLSGQQLTPPAENGSICNNNSDNLVAISYTGINYTATSTTYSTYTGIPGPVLGFNNLYGGYAHSNPLQFNFNFYGTSYSSCYINENGFISFGSGFNSTSSQSIPNFGTPNNLIALAWSNLDISNGNQGQVDSFTIGTAPYRKFVINYIRIPFNAGASDTGHLWGQIVLCETTNNIEMYIGAFTHSSTSTVTATEGIENAAGSAATIIQGWNNTIWSTTNNAYILTPTGGSFTYSWTPSTGLSPSPYSSSVTTPNLTASGTYTVTATEQYGCSATQSIGVTVNPLPTFTTTQTNDSCNGESDGTITVTASGGPGLGYKYSKDNGNTWQNSNVFTGLSPATYTLMVKDSINDYFCSSAASMVVITQPAILSFTTNTTNVLCNGGSTGSITVTASGGTTPYIYSKNGGSNYQTSNVFGNLPISANSIVVKDNNLCFTNPPVVVSVTQPNPISITSVTHTNVSTCFGFSNGGITVNGTSGGTSPFSFSKDAGSTYQSSNIFSGLTAATYTVKVKDNNSCTLSVSPNTTLTQPQQVLLSINNSLTSNVSPCHGSNNGIITVSATGGTGTKTYSKNGGVFYQGSTIFANLAAGSYSLVAKDANGCVSPVVTKVITQPDSVTFTYTETDVVCYGNGNGTITMTGFGGNVSDGYYYSIDSGNTSVYVPGGSYTFANLVPGTYHMVAWDGDWSQCTSGVVSVTVNQPPLLTFTTLITNVTGCIGGSNAIVEIDATGGLGTLLYSIDGGQNFFTSHIFSNLFAGTYNIMVKDANSCTASSTVVVGQPTQTYFTEDPTYHLDDTLCYGVAMGRINLLGHGGTGFYHYSDNGGNSFVPYSLFTGLTGGVYNCQIVDNNGCLSGISSITITQPAAIVLSTTVQNANCNSNSTGSISIVATGGTGTLSYSDNGGSTYQSGSHFTGLASGVYNIEVKDRNSCTATSSVSITQPGTLLASATGTNLTCNGNNTGTVHVSVSGGTQPYYYNWNNTYNTPNVTGLAAGTYNITVTDANNCVSQSTVTITEPLALTVSAVETDLTCNGNNSGTVSLTVGGGTGPYSFNWNSNAYTTENLSGLAAGTYSVIVNDADGCSVSSSISVGQPDILTATATPYNLYCNGDNSGEVTLEITGGTASYDFDWNNGAYNTQDLFNIPADTYTVFVTDANGCTTTTSTVVTEPSVLTATTSETDLLCNGDGSGTADVTVSGGTGPYYFIWDTGDTTPNISGLSAGTYEVTIYDNNGCMQIADVLVNEPDLIGATASGSNLSCNGNSSGAVSVVATGGTLPYNYIWSSGSTASVQSGLPAGTYTVTVSDVNGCLPFITSVTITEPSVLSAATTGTNLTCNGSGNGTVSASASGGTGNYGYLWNGGATTATQSGLSSGTYTVTVTDQNGCTSVSSIAISQPAVLAVTTSGTSLTCNGSGNGTVSASSIGGTGNYGYLWSNGAVTATQGGLAAATYTVTVTDQNGCTATNSQSVTQPAVLTASATGTALSCNGSGNGTVSVSVNGGTGPYGYSWSNISNASSQSGLAAGTYTVTVTDHNGCSTSSTVTVNQPAVLVATASGTNLTCNGNGSGSVNVSISGGNGGNTFNWTGPNNYTSSLQNPGNLAAGTYNVTVTDHNGCSSFSSIVISQPVVLAVTTSGTSLTCNGSGNGTVSASSTGGTGNYGYLWNNGAVTATQGGLAAATYTVTVTDQNGCTATNSQSITQPAVLTASATGTALSCNGSGNGTVSVSVNGGTGPYGYSWSNISNASSQSNLAAGTYTVTVTDHNGCSTTSSVTVNQPAVLVATASGTNLTCNGNGSGSVNVSISGGNGGNTFNWTGPNNYTSSLQNPGNLAAGTYNVTVTDAHGCSSTSSATITQTGTLVATATGTNLTCNGINNGTMSVSISGGVTPYSYAWSNSSTTSGLSSLAPGTYMVAVSDGNLCTAVSNSVTLTQPTAVVINSTPSQYVVCNGANTGADTVHASGGTGTLTYSNNNASTFQGSNVFSSLVAGTYTTVVKDANSCVSSPTNVVITQHTAITYTPTINPVVGCFGGNNGSISFPTGSVSGGGSSYTYSDNGGSSYQGPSNFTHLIAGTYSVIVKDNYGCTSTGTNAIITQPAQVIISLSSSTNEVCNGTSIGSLTVSATGGDNSFKYSKNGGTPVSSPTFGALAAGTYTMTAVDNNSCVSSPINVVITQPALVTFTDTNHNASNCVTNSADGSITVFASGGTSPYYYSKNGGANWSNVSQNVFSNLTAGTYTIKVKDFNSCPSATSNDILACNSPRESEALSGMGTNFAFTVYPNPANDHAMVEFSTDGANAYKIRLTDVLGRTLMNIDGISVIGDNQRQLDVEGLAKGVYMISIEIGANQKTLKLVLQ